MSMDHSTDIRPEDLLEQTLKLARSGLSPTPGDKARHRSALGLRAVAPQEPVVPKSVPRSWSALQASGKTGALVSAALLGVGFGTGYWLRGAQTRVAVDPPVEVPALLETTGGDGPSRTPASSDAVVEPHAGESAATTKPAHGHPITDPAKPVADPKPIRRPAAISASHEPSRDTEELALMRRVERSLRSEQPALALALLAELEKRFPNTGLTEERAAASVMAYCGLQDAGHERRAETFLESHPRSVYRARVMAACQMGAAGRAEATAADSNEGKPSSGDQ